MGVEIPTIESSIHPLQLDEPPPFPMPTRIHFLPEPPDAPDSTDVDATMLAFQETMRAFLETQRAVLGEYLGRTNHKPGPSPAPGSARSNGWSPGRRSRRSTPSTRGPTRSPSITRSAAGSSRRSTRRSKGFRSCRSR